AVLAERLRFFVGGDARILRLRSGDGRDEHQGEDDRALQPPSSSLASPAPSVHSEPYSPGGATRPHAVAAAIAITKRSRSVRIERRATPADLDALDAARD